MKKILLFTVAIIISVATIAFSEKGRSKPVVNEVWEFIGEDDSEATNPENYVLLDGSPMFTCDNVDYTVCRITAPIDENSDPGDPKPEFQTGTNPVTHGSLYSASRRSDQ